MVFEPRIRVPCALDSSDSRQQCDHQTWQKDTRKSLLRRQMHTGKLSRHLGSVFLNQARFHPGRGKSGCISWLRAALGCRHAASHRTCDQKLVGAAGQHRDHHTGSRLPEVRTLLSRSAMPFSKVALGHAAGVPTCGRLWHASAGCRTEFAKQTRDGACAFWSSSDTGGSRSTLCPCPKSSWKLEKLHEIICIYTRVCPKARPRL